MSQPLNLDAYLARINYTGPRTPTYDTARRYPPRPYRQHSLRKLRCTPRSPHPSRPREPASQDRYRPPRRLLFRAWQVSCTPLSKPSASLPSGTPLVSSCSNRGTKACVSTCFSRLQLAVLLTSSIQASDPFPALSQFRGTALLFRGAHPPTASLARVTIGSFTSSRMANKCKVGSLTWKKSIPSISR